MTVNVKQYGVYKGITNGYLNVGTTAFTITYPNFLGSDNCTINFTSFDTGDAMRFTYKNVLHVIGGASSQCGRSTWESDMCYYQGAGYWYDSTYNLQSSGFITGLTGSRDSLTSYPSYAVTINSGSVQHYWVCYTELFVTSITLG